MAVLTEAERQQIWRGLMRWWSSRREFVSGVTKADLKAAVDAVDAWVDANAANFNTALPVAARTSLTASQKTLLLVAVALRRHDLALLRRIFQEVD